MPALFFTLELKEQGNEIVPGFEDLFDKIIYLTKKKKKKNWNQIYRRLSFCEWNQNSVTALLWELQNWL